MNSELSAFNGKFYNPRLETLSRSELSRLQQHRLKRVIDYAYRQSPLIRSLWDAACVKPADISTFSDFETKVPFYNKDTIREYRDRFGDPLGGLSRLSDLALNRIATTSGTTGDPTPIPIRRSTSIDEFWLRVYWEMGCRPGDHIILPTFTFRVGIEQRFIQQCGLIPIAFNHDIKQIPLMVRAIQQYKPVLFALMSSPLMSGFEAWFEENNINPREVFASVKSVVFGGEALSPRLKRLASEWGLEFYENTGLGDVMTAMECDQHDGFHAFEDMVYVECIDPNGTDPVPDGEIGELVVTTLKNPELPFIRYRSDDLIILNRDRCACGRTHARFHIRGRKGDQLLVQGKLILPIDIRHIIENEPQTRAGLFQLIKTEGVMNELKLLVGYRAAESKSEGAALAQRLQTLLSSDLEVPVQIELTPESELLKLGPPHKIPRVTKR